MPSVTTILDVIAKPALAPWYAKQERRYFETAMLEVLSKPGARDPEYVLSAVVDAVGGVKAADREKQRAATIGTAIHAGIEWQLRTRLGEDAGRQEIEVVIDPQATNVGTRVTPAARQMAMASTTSARVWCLSSRARMSSSSASTALVMKRHPVSRRRGSSARCSRRCWTLMVTS